VINNVIDHAAPEALGTVLTREEFMLLDLGRMYDGLTHSACAGFPTGRRLREWPVSLGVEQAQVCSHAPLVISREDGCCWSGIINCGITA
jgi:hypothetical protein